MNRLKAEKLISEIKLMQLRVKPYLMEKTMVKCLLAEIFVTLIMRFHVENIRSIVEGGKRLLYYRKCCHDFINDTLAFKSLNSNKATAMTPMISYV